VTDQPPLVPAEQYKEYVRLAHKMLRNLNLAPASQKRRVAQALIDAVAELQAAQEREKGLQEAWLERERQLNVELRATRKKLEALAAQRTEEAGG